MSLIATLANQVKKLKERFALERVVLVGDRGMITEARIEEVLKPAGLDWITTLRAPAIRGLAEAGSLQLSLFDERDLATIGISGSSTAASVAANSAAARRGGCASVLTSRRIRSVLLWLPPWPRTRQLQSTGSTRPLLQTA